MRGFPLAAIWLGSENTRLGQCSGMTPEQSPPPIA